MHGDKRRTLHVHTLGLLLRYRFGFVLVLLLGMCCFVLGIWCRKPLQSYGRYVRQKNKWMAQNLLEIHISIHHNGKIHLEHVLKGCKPSGAYGRFWHPGGMASCSMGSPGMAMCGMGRPGMTRCGMGSPGMAKCGMGSWHLVLPEIVRVRVITLNGIAK